MSWGRLAGSEIGGSHFCETWELRITKRCLVDDLGLPEDATFAAAKRLGIVRAFVKQRCANPVGGSWLGPTPRGGNVGYAWLRHGNRERAITVYDEREGVVWMTAYSPEHTSGSVDPAQVHFHELWNQGELLPADVDEVQRLKERDDARAELLVVQGRYMMDRARETGAEYRDHLPGDINAAVVVEYEPGIEAVTFAFTITNRYTQNREIQVLLAGLYPEDKWELVSRMPSGRRLGDNEIGWQHHHER